MSPRDIFRLRLAALTVAIVVIGVPTVHTKDAAAEFKTGGISIEAPWSRATPGEAKVAAGYLTIKNKAAAPDRLVSATTDIAERTEVHQVSMTDGMMKMRQVSDGVPVPAGGAVVLAHNGYHLMFLGLKRPLMEGETFASKLAFEKAGIVDVTFEVRGVGAPDAGAEHHH
jgi:periplasmic copper chaperone A